MIEEAPTNWNSPLALTLRPSRQLTLLLTSMHVLSLLPLPAMDLPPWLLLSTTAALIASLVHTLRRYTRLTAPGAVRELRWREGEGWSVTLGNGEELMIDLLPGTWVQAPLVLLHCRSRGMIYDLKIPIAADMLDDADFRRLRARLRWGTPPGDS